MVDLSVPNGVELPPDPAAVARARSFVADRCRSLRFDSLCDNAQLVVSELVSNSIRHAHTDVVVGVECVDGRLRVHVADCSPEPPTPRAGGLFDEGGRGLMLVDALATRWGVVVAGRGKRVWAELAPDGAAV